MSGAVPERWAGPIRQMVHEANADWTLDKTDMSWAAHRTAALVLADLRAQVQALVDEQRRIQRASPDIEWHATHRALAYERVLDLIDGGP